MLSLSASSCSFSEEALSPGGSFSSRKECEEAEVEEEDDVGESRGKSVVDRRLEFRSAALRRRSTVEEAAEFDQHIQTMRVTHESPRKNFHYREKKKRKLQKWIDKKLWNVDRAMLEGDLRNESPRKVQAFSSILQETPVNYGRSSSLSEGWCREVVQAAGDGGQNVEEKKEEDGYSEISEESDSSEFIEEEDKVEKEEYSDYSSVGSSEISTFDIINRDAMFDLSELGGEGGGRRRSRSKSGRKSEHSQGSVLESEERPTSFAYHDEDDGGVQL